MAGMNFIGSYSGIDKNTIDQLMAAEKMPLLKLSNAKTSITEKQNAWKDINTRLNSLFEKIKTLQSNSTFTSKTSTSSNDKNVSMTAGNNATAGTYKIKVGELATSTSMTGKTIDSIYDVEKKKYDLVKNLEMDGKFTIENADKVKVEIDIVVGDSLKSVVDKINASTKDRTIDGNKISGSGINASIIDGRIVLTDLKTGIRDIKLENTVEGKNIINDLGFKNSPTDTEKGVQAKFNINGVDIKSDSNTVTNVLEATTINLTKAHDPLNSADYDTVTIAQDNTVLTKAVQDFVDQYNSTMTFIEDKMKAGDPKLVGSKGTLAGDSSLMRLHSSLRNLVTSPTTNSNTDIKDMSQLGVTTIDKFGQLKFDASKLAKELSKDADGVKNFFNSTVGGKEVGFTTRLKDYVDSFITSDKGVIKVKTESFDKTLKDLTTQIDNFSARMEKKEAYYIKKFTALDVAIMKSEDQMSWLQGQVDSMNGIKR